MPRYQNAIVRAQEPDLARHRFEGVKVWVNASNILVQVILSAGASGRFQ
jgi:hypothetical protein